MKTIAHISDASLQKLKLQSKKLKSGKVQVKFTIATAGPDDCYGYVLTNAETTLKEVVKTIQMELSLLKNADQYYHQHLYAINKPKLGEPHLMLFWKN